MLLMRMRRLLRLRHRVLWWEWRFKNWKLGGGRMGEERGEFVFFTFVLYLLGFYNVQWDLF
jgi:hypothetical protein